LLFQDALADEPSLETAPSGERFPVLDEPTEVILAKLKEVDPVMADRWHPNERRKIQRSLEIYLQTGKPASQIYEEQRKRREAALKGVPPSVVPGTGPGLRFPTVLFWVHAPKDVLNLRLDARIEKMLKRGLLEEVRELSDFRRTYEAQTGKPVDQTRGIWVSIGYKEFLEYQAALSATPESPDLQKLKKVGTESAQAATRQYAKRQVRWISIKLLNALFNAGQRNNTFVLDGSDLSKWEEHVIEPAADITRGFLSGDPLPSPSELSALAKEMLVPKRDYDLSQRPDLWQKLVCEPCGATFQNQNDWNLHIKSRGHRRQVSVKKKEAKGLSQRATERKKPQKDMVDILENCQSTLEQKESSE
jgi:tRNA dimethylallyltransferase